MKTPPTMDARFEKALSMLKQPPKPSAASVYQRVIDSIPHAIFWKDTNSVVMGCNEYYAKTTGFKNTAAAIGKSMFEVGLPQHVAQKAIDEDRRVMESGKVEMNLEMEIPNVDWTVRTNLVTKIPMRDDQGRVIGVSVVFRDITEKKRAEKELRDAKDLADYRLKELQKTHEELRLNQASLVQATKMASLGVMASGLAHEVNNPLAIIKCNAEELQLMLELGTATPENLRAKAIRIDETVNRIAKIIHGLRSFARDSSQDEFVQTSVHALVEDTLSFCGAKFKNSGVQITVDLAADLPCFEGRTVQISQVLLNLLNNAFDAVEAEKDKWIRVESRQKDSGIEIAVVDNGKGIPLELLTRIMEPFFTTKEVGKGTGLGLSISRGILESHKGQLYIDHESKNTRIAFWLPVRQ